MKQSLPVKTLLAALVVVVTGGCGTGSSQPRKVPPPRMSKPTRVERAEPSASASVAPDAGPAVFEGNIAEAIATKRCTTSIIRGLNEQIVAEANCLAEHSLARIPDLPNLTLDKSVLPYLALPARDALVAVLKDSPKRKMKINSALRTVAQQYMLYRWYKLRRCGISLAARPGKSNHESGLAIDVSRPLDWRKRLSKKRFRWFGKKDRWHFDYRGGRGVKKRPDGLDVAAFQRLWNRNHPDDPIGEDGDYGESTEERLRQAPAAGFAVGPSCAPTDD